MMQYVTRDSDRLEAKSDQELIQLIDQLDGEIRSRYSQIQAHERTPEKLGSKEVIAQLESEIPGGMPKYVANGTRCKVL